MLTVKIALIAPNKEFTLQALDLFSEWKEKIHVAIASKEDVLLIARQFCEKRVDAIICYEPFVKIVKTTVTIPIVSLKPGLLDIMRSMENARERLLAEQKASEGQEAVQGKAVGVIGDSIVDNAAILADILKIKIKVLSEITEDAPDGTAVVIREIPRIIQPENQKEEILPNGLPSFAVTVGREELLRTVRHTREIVLESRKNWGSLEQFKTIMEFTGEGIIAVDRQKTVTYVNYMAEKLLKIKKDKIIGTSAEAFFPGINLDDALQYGQTRFFSWGAADNSLSCRIVPMIISNHIIGAVAAITAARGKSVKTGGAGGHKAVYSFDDFVTVNEATRETIQTAKYYAGADSPIMIIGETGTGKEIIAQSIHNYSRRSRAPFVAVNCAALPESLLESELFGYEYGAFTGARKNGKKGLFEQADTGTIFLDEIGEIPLSMQARLLRVIQQREIMRIGADKVIPVDVLIIAATHRNLLELIEKGLFRRDLYHRLNVLELKILPLAKRAEDIPCLLDKINKKLSSKFRRQPLKFSREAMRVLTEYSWPGNVRELENVIERLIIFKKGADVPDENDVFPAIDTSFEVTGGDIKKMLAYASEEEFGREAMIIPKGTMEEMEKAIIKEVLKETQNQDEAAKILGISTTTIWRKMK